MAEFKISRIRYTWRNEWQTSTSYNRDDVIRYGGSSWVCIRQHTSSAFTSDQEFLANPNDTDFSPAWVKMTDGYEFRGDWQSSTLYNLGDIVAYGGVLYLCIISYTSTSIFDENIDNFAVYAISDSWNTAWVAETRYGVGDVVSYNGIVYRCIQGHTSSSTANGLEFDSSKWEVYYSNVVFRGEYASSIRYRPNDLVIYNGTLLRNTIGYTSSDTFSSTYWDVEFPGFEFNEDWDNATYYGIGSVVRHGGFLYRGIRSSYNVNPSESAEQGGNAHWEILSKGINFRGSWNVNLEYKSGDVVRRGGNLYVAKIDTGVGDGSSLDYLDDSNWEILAPSQNWRNFWSESVLYSVNDLVIYLGNTYKCNFEHTSSPTNFPGDNGEGFFYWDLVLQSSSPAGLKQRGDLLTFDLSREDVGDGSTFDLTSVELGDEGQLLTVNNEDRIIYKDYAQINRVFYVSPSGIDDLTDTQRGVSPFKPWKTVRFAAEQADDGFDGTTTINVDTGEYEEILPIIVPKKTVILGSELRSTTIKPNQAITALENDASYTIAVLNRLSSIIDEIIRGQSITKTFGNTLDPVIPTRTTSTQVPFDPPRFEGTPAVEVFQTVTTTSDVVGNSMAATSVQDLIADIVSYINFYVNSTGEDPEITGTNTATTDQAYLDTALVLEANKDFLAEEAVFFMLVNFNDYDFDSDLYRRDVRRYVDSWIYDITYTGNYKSILAARYYRNAVLGSLTEDMFYCRDATGVRNCTLSGLTGALNPANVFDLFRRPTGGSYVSLDPGWGPADDRTWITSRSPYIQGVTTIGTGCIGQKIDGSLHNGGNKSITSNDFTQVLSDGVGAWVLNNGRAELVSVFTYYCQVGYLAEDGGIIRSTNGNCSYGTFGAIAEGIDNTEVPRTATVNTRTEQAIVAAAFSGDFVDEIQLIEWTNAGQNYTQATADIIGSGVNAEVKFEDFRDDAVFQARLLDVSTNPAITSIGGGGFGVSQNNAQVHATPGGDETSITIATSDDNDEADYLGKRVILTSGVGTGQYGYVTAYNTSTKVVSVARESDDQPGWDHVVPGTPNAVFNTSTVYRIEPRVTFSDPGFTATAHTSPITTNFISSIYGETTETYNNITGDAGTGDTIGISPATATFDITKVGRSYEVEIDDAGAGYEVGDVITVTGDNLGGTTPENDLEITVTEISDDSTNSIISFTSEGIGASGKFIILPSDGEVGIYSSNGESWTDTQLPSSGDWTCLASGNNRFVTIQNDSNVAASSLNGIDWTARSMPTSQEWNAVTYGDGVFLAVAGTNDAGAHSTNGISWTATTLPDSDDSTFNEWVDVTYGKNKFIALANSNNMVAEGVYNESTSTFTWESHIMDVVADSSQKDWISIAYGNNRFVALSTTGEVAYSFQGTNWLSAFMPTQDGSTAHYWRKIVYAQGVFFAIGDTGSRDVAGDTTSGPTTFCATSPDGINWTSREFTEESNWRTICFGNPYTSAEDSSVGKNTPMWIAAADNSNVLNKIRTGARALGRVTVSAGVIGQVKLWNPGSGYRDNPSITVYDPNSTSDPSVENRLADGVLSEPSWLNRGLGYRSASTRVTISGDGFADIIPVGKFVTINGLSKYPGPGTQITFAGNSKIYTIVTITEQGQFDEGLQAFVRVTPELKVIDKLEHGTTASLRERYAQCRITGHDFLDIGTGNFENTNYPELYSTGLYVPAPENEVREDDGGRVFYTSTDQSGNFRTGELFAVEQATGIVTISSDFFDLSGLTELRLGGVRLGGSGAVIREFSTDATFTEDSNNVVPTQRAIAAYLASRLSLGGSEIATSSFVAGTVRVGPDFIGNTAGLRIVVPVKAVFEGETSKIRGSILAQTMFFKASRTSQ